MDKTKQPLRVFCTSCGKIQRLDPQVPSCHVCGEPLFSCDIPRDDVEDDYYKKPGRS